MLSIFRQYFLPAIVFQSVIIAGGYGTGRELVEFFLGIGPRSGVLGLAVAAVIWSAVCALTYESARQFQAYDYRLFFQRLLGRGWIAFEIAYVMVILLVLSVVAASAGSLLQANLGLPYNLGVISLLVYICYMVFRGSRVIERALTFWSVVLYLTYAFCFYCCFQRFGDTIREVLLGDVISSHSPWLLNGVRYAGYNLGLIPAVLFSCRYIKTRKQAYFSGLFTGIMGIIPAMLFYFCMLGLYPQIQQAAVPSSFLLQALDFPILNIVFHFVLVGTLVETGTGLLHAINERIASQCQDSGRSFPKLARPMIAAIFLSISVLLAQVGLTSLIVDGYGALTWGILLVYVVPLIIKHLKQAISAPARG